MEEEDQNEDDNNFDLYADILEPDNQDNQAVATSEECERLKEELQIALSSNQTLQRQADILRKNISVLYVTAKGEIQRKKDQLAELQRNYDALIFRRGKRDFKTTQPVCEDARTTTEEVCTDGGKFLQTLAVKISFEATAREISHISGEDSKKLALLHGIGKKSPKKKAKNDPVKISAAKGPQSSDAKMLPEKPENKERIYTNRKRDIGNKSGSSDNKRRRFSNDRTRSVHDVAQPRYSPDRRDMRISSGRRRRSRSPMRDRRSRCMGDDRLR